MRISDWSSDVCSSDRTGGIYARGCRRCRVLPQRAARCGRGRASSCGDLLGAMDSIGEGAGAGFDMRRGGVVMLRDDVDAGRSDRLEKRLVGKEGVSKWRSRGATVD